MLSDFAKRVANKFRSGFDKLINRIGLWVVKGHSAFTLGQIYQPTPLGQEEPRFEWVYGDTIEHCTDCAHLHGKVLTASEWRQAGIRPQSPDLECGGWRCGCQLVPTDKPSIGLGAI